MTLYCSTLQNLKNMLKILFLIDELNLFSVTENKKTHNEEKLHKI